MNMEIKNKQQTTNKQNKTKTKTLNIYFNELCLSKCFEFNKIT